MSSNEIDVAAIRAREQAATGGPWEASGCYVEDIPEFDLHRFDIMPLTIAKTDQSKADAEFIAHARADVPALLDALEAAESEVKRLRCHDCQATTREADEEISAAHDDRDAAQAEVERLTTGLRELADGTEVSQRAIQHSAHMGKVAHARRHPGTDPGDFEFEPVWPLPELRALLGDHTDGDGR